MRKNAMFSLTAAGSLALSIGALTIAYSAVNAIVFKPLPIADPERVVYLQNGTIGWSYPDYRDLQERLDVDALAGYRIAMMNVGLEPEPSILWGYLVTGNYFEALGITAAAGRFFTPQEDAGEAPVAVLGYDTWQARFAGRAGVIGSTIPINGQPFTIIGVAPRGFHGVEKMYRPEIWVPIRLQPVIEARSSWLANRATQNLWVVARLRRGDTQPAAEAKIGAAVSQLSKEHPRNGHLQLRLTRPGWFGDNLGAPVRAFAWGLFGLGVLLMMAGCSNLAGLLLARGNDRVREIALRTALGAGKTRIARQLLTESMLLAACGGLGGAAIAWAGTRAISARRLPTELPVQFDVTADLNVLLFATAAAIVVGLLVGVAPARFASRLDLNRSLKSAAGVAIGGRRLQGREILVCLQVAFCLVLLHASFLAVRGLQRAANSSLGWNPRRRGDGRHRAGHGAVRRPQVEAYWQRIVEEARALPGVVVATTANSLPLHIDQSGTTLFANAAGEPDRGISATFYSVSSDYFATLQIPFREGRDFTAFDTRESPQVAIVNRAAAERLFGGNAIGKPVREGRGGAPIEIVGVVEDGKYTAPRRAAPRRDLPSALAALRELVDADRPQLTARRSHRRGPAAADPSRRSRAADSDVGHGRANYGAAAVSLPRRGCRARPARTDRERLAAVRTPRHAGLRRGQASARDRHPRRARRRPRLGGARPCCRA